MVSSPIEALKIWVDATWPSIELAEAEALSWQPLSGDAGFRRYFRMDNAPPVLAVYAPPATEDAQAFINIASAFRAAGVLAPRVFAYELSQGFMLIEDLGEALLFDKLLLDKSLSDKFHLKAADGLYDRALQSLSDIQNVPSSELNLPVYDQTLLRAEMNLFPQWFCTALLGRPLQASESGLLNQIFEALEQSALTQPQVLVHRDFHSRNLIFREYGPLGVIDFQDAVIGPVTYDLVSLLRDCYVAWPAERIENWLQIYFQSPANQNKLDGVSFEKFTQWFDWMGLQRHIKVLGIFARLSLRDGKHGYLSDLPLVLRYTLGIAKRYPQLQPFCNWFDAELMPLVKTQSWYKAEYTRQDR